MTGWHRLRAARRALAVEHARARLADGLYQRDLSVLQAQLDHTEAPRVTAGPNSGPADRTRGPGEALPAAHQEGGSS
ncbi:hypothetical protein [Streptomyces hebeiensis]